jgi:hypothetical protein
MNIFFLQLKYRLSYTNLQNKINLPSRDVFDDNLAVIAGWGASFSDPNLTSIPLLKAPVTISSFVTCSANVPFVVFDNQFCAYNPPGVEVCAVSYLSLLLLLLLLLIFHLLLFSYF